MSNPTSSSDVTEARQESDLQVATPDGVAPAPASPGHRAWPAKPPPGYPFKQRFTWWARRPGYRLYMLREFTAVGIAGWMILFLVEIARARQGPQGYQPLGGPIFAGVSIVCLGLALWHGYTFLSLAGLIMRIPIGTRTVSPRLIVRGAFGGLVVITAVIAGLLIWGGV